MPDSALNKVRNDVLGSPAADRLKDELQNYLRARAEHTVTRLGHRLGEGVSRLAQPGSGAGGALGSLAKGGQALSEGKSPAQAAVSAAASHVKDTMKDKVKGLFGKGRKSGGGKSKSVTIVEDIDVGVPVREAYDQWTQFQEFSTFAKGVVSVEKADDTTSNWKVKVAKSTRSWKANVTEQIPDERITWTTEGAKGTVKGVVTFHAVTDDLTRVLLVLEYFPKGLFEKTGNIWRAQGRRARLDLKLYRKFIMMRGEATDGWRGEIRDGEVVVEHDDAVEQEQAETEADAEGEEGYEPEDDAGEYADEHDDAEASDEPDETDEAVEDEYAEPAEDEDDGEFADEADEADESGEDEFADEPYDEADEAEESDEQDAAEEDVPEDDAPEDDASEHDDEPAPRSSRRRRTADAGA
ncbi:SRPBCC family protein [Streptomyces sp. t39]|uniref:SRPBCC family protein n=1 Tax=Streptomyces sp. t39 TaxID=1828156 RepID=UPI0011CE3E7E|nr:SRPBCC family protein [Streptomyces sp. t39]TXS52654.1 cyclase [Streptomyces sp. t39]